MTGPLEPVTLVGRHVALRPLAHADRDALVDAVRDGELWRLWYTSVPSPDEMAGEIERRLALHAAGCMLPWTVLDGPDGQVVGMTTYMNVDAAAPRVEIGSTWYAKSVQRSALNTQAKLLPLEHAFGECGCLAVEFRTHWMNAASRRAIERLGAKLDGVLRSHQRAKNGTIRDTCVYSVIAGEWPRVRAHLQFKLDVGTS